LPKVRLFLLALEATAVENGLSRARSILEAAIEHASAGIVIANASEMTIRFISIAGHRIIDGSETPLRNVPIADYLQGWTLLRADGTPHEAREHPLERALFD
jgi:hypothetical protein